MVGVFVGGCICCTTPPSTKKVHERIHRAGIEGAKTHTDKCVYTRAAVPACWKTPYVEACMKRKCMHVRVCSFVHVSSCESWGNACIRMAFKIDKDLQIIYTVSIFVNSRLLNTICNERSFAITLAIAGGAHPIYTQTCSGFV